MFAKSVVGSGRFLRMPATSRLLYYDLGMEADDDGAVEAFGVMRKTGATEDDLAVLVSKGFVKMLNKDLVAYILDWGVNNQIRKDRYHESVYKDLISAACNVILLDGGATETDGLPVVDTTVTEMGAGKGAVENQPSFCEEGSYDSKARPRPSQRQKVIDAWNTLSVYGIPPVRKIVDGSKRADWLKARLAQYGLKMVLEAISRISQSDFLKGHNSNGWVITFDWFVRPSNFSKVLEGNYDNRTGESGAPQVATSGTDRLLAMIERGDFDD